MTFFMRLQRRTLLCLGFSLRPDESIGCKILVGAHTILLALIVVAEVCYVVKYSDDLVLASNAMCTVLYCCMSLPKLVTMQADRPKWYRLMCALDGLWANANAKDQLILKNFSRIDRTMSWLFSVSCYVAGSMYLIYPLARGNYDQYTTGKATWVMPMKSIFPYDVQSTPYYELTYVWFVQATYAAIVGSAATDTFYYGCALNLSGHLRIVQHRLDALRYEQRGNIYGCAGGISDELRQLLRYHAQVLELCDVLLGVCVPFVFTQFLIASMQLCVVGYQLTLPFESYVTLATFVMFLWSICFECYVYCHAGAKLLTESLAVSDAIFASRWYETPDTQTRKCVQIFIARSQKAVAVRGIFFDANLGSFTSIMSKAVSYITLLQALPG